MVRDSGVEGEDDVHPLGEDVHSFFGRKRLKPPGLGLDGLFLSAM
jgi:hypothetical protein